MTHTPPPDPRLAEDVVSAGELALRRRASEEERARIAEAVAWLMDRIRVELRGGGPGA